MSYLAHQLIDPSFTGEDLILYVFIQVGRDEDATHQSIGSTT